MGISGACRGEPGTATRRRSRPHCEKQPRKPQWIPAEYGSAARWWNTPAATPGPYTTVVADTTEPLPVQPNHESAELAWAPKSAVTALDLHPAFAASWPALQAVTAGLVVDEANVVGSRPDGWWRDRAGAAERLLRDIAAAGPGVL